MGSESETGSKATTAGSSSAGDFGGAVWSAAVNAFGALLLGWIAFALVGGIVGRMIPSAPPGFDDLPALPAQTDFWWNLFVSIRYQLLFAVVFLVCLRAELGKRAAAIDDSKCNPRWRRIGQSFAQNWFGSLIGNAFLAMALAHVMAKVPSFSWWQWVWHWLVGWLHPGQYFGGTGARWFAWYDHNQIRFNFWLIYLAAVSDDFGIPNFKSFVRWIWRCATRPKVLPPAAGLPRNSPDQRPINVD